MRAAARKARKVDEQNAGQKVLDSQILSMG
jgi:hypothetical protein